MLKPFLVALAAVILALPAHAEPLRRHAVSLIGEPALPADFAQLPYVRADAPKGGRLRLSAIGAFDSFNPVPNKGLTPGSLGLVFQTLMTTSLDEASTEYGLIAEWVSYPDDYSSVTYGLRAGAKWHDGQPVTPEDVVFSMETLKANNEFYRQYYKNVTGAEKTGEREVTFRFDTAGNRELPQIVGQLLVLPKHWWASRDPSRTSLDIPLGSGPYRLKSFDVPRSVVYERVANSWAKDLPVMKGQYNFDEVRIEYFRDPQIAFEAFKGDQYDVHVESSALNWATRYDFPALKDGRVTRRADVLLETPEAMQAFVLNTRRPKFADPRVRRAFNLALDFDWINANLFFGQYKRTTSFFENTELAATALPDAAELAILEPLRAQVPPEVFTTVYANPAGDARTRTREAVRLLAEAGWTLQNGVLTNGTTGETMVVEFMLDSPQFQRVVLPYIQSLERLGIKSTVRQVDASQEQQRTDAFDYDIIVGQFAQSESPGNEQRDFWGSAAADRNASRNLIGVKNPAVDTLIDRIIFAKARPELVAATRALDRVLQWNHYVVPQWYAPNERFAYWARFGMPERFPKRSLGILQTWWVASGKAAAAQ